MRRTQIFLWILLPVLGFGWGQAKAAQQASSPDIPLAKVAVIDTSILAEDGGIEQLVQQRKLLEARFRPRFDELDKLRKQLQALQQEIQTKSPNWTPEVRQQKQDEFERFQRDAKRKAEDLDRESQREQRRVTAPISERIQTYLQQYATRRGITLVIDVAPLRQAGALPYVNEATNITKDFINDYNKAYPATQPAQTSQ